jgi:hypothetical protein
MLNAGPWRHARTGCSAAADINLSPVGYLWAAKGRMAQNRWHVTFCNVPEGTNLNR